MLHDPDEKDEGSDEPEYHFSEEEGGDYAETEIPKEAAPTTSESKAISGGSLAPSKRMIVSLLVFLVLVYVVYKMVAPTSSVPATDITAQATVSQVPKNAAPATANMQQTLPPAVPAAQTAQMNAPETNPNPTPQMTAQVSMPPAPPTQSAAMTPPPSSISAPPIAEQGQIIPVGQQPITQSSTAPPMPSTQPLSPTSPAPPSMTPQPPATGQPSPMAPPLQTTQPSPAQAPMVQAPMVQAASALSQQAQQAITAVTGMPSVIPVQTPTPAPPVGNNNMSNMSNDSRIVALQADSAKLMNQLQADYGQKLNDFSAQNKALQDQIQILNSRIATMEAQINQLVQTLTVRQGQNGASVSEPPPIPVEQISTEQRISYNVQAIIPGRAWLRADNGETLTVAEGDVIKSLGRVTKIDPYDGVVEINTGNKVVSLSYGTSA